MHCFLPTGFDGNEMTFMCPSFTSDDEYEILFDLHTKLLSCSCKDASCRGKNWLPVNHERSCKHCKMWGRVIWPTIERALK